MDHFFSTNLVEGCKEHLLFLTALHKAGVTLAPSAVESLRRYVELWLPLVHKIQQQSVALIPPPDVAWLWHCHRLAPLKYEAYVKGRFGRVLEASPAFAVQTEPPEGSDDAGWCDAKKATRDAWNDAYPDQPFFLPAKARQSSDRLTSHECRMILNEFDLLASMESQSTFLWQVARPQFQDDEFLQQGVDRYYKFLKLSKFTGENIVLVPTYQIDLVWHTHILSSIRLYNEDCLKICGHKFFHDDSLGEGDRTPGAELDRAFRATESMWRREYDNESYTVDGAMYRGEPPPQFYDSGSCGIKRRTAPWHFA